MPNPVVHFEVVGRDAARLQAFYKQVFDWQMQPVMPTYAMAHPNAPGGINGGVGATQDGSAGHVTFYVEVPDLDITLAAIERAGGRRVMGPMDVPGGPTIAMFADPEGHVVGLVRTTSRQA